jgi:hypothetical protein
MIRTIGSLVQETSNRVRWLVSTSLYVMACTVTSCLAGALLGSVGLAFYHIPCVFSSCSLFPAVEYVLVGGLAIAYAFSDAGLIDLPRPYLMKAVPLVWWRRWRPYGASLAYGAALGLGLTTRIQFGAFYVLCVWCILKGNILYGAVLMGVYGIIRALVLFPASWGVYVRCADSETLLHRMLAFLGNAKLVIAVVLILFGTQIIVSAFFLIR